MDIVNSILVGGTVFLGGVVLIALRPSRQREQQPQQPQKPTPDIPVSITLEKLSALWAQGQQTGEVKIEDLAPIWRENVEPVAPEKKIYNFQNRKIADFFYTNIDKAPWFRKAPLQKDVCFQILSLLEIEGQCPSVVNAADDVEASWDSTTYDLLGKTSLLDHSLNVAMEAIKILIKEDATHVIPDTLVAALGHDLGKLPSVKGHLYSLGEHPLAAGRVLVGIPEFKQLKRKDEISRAVKLHHKKPEGLLGGTLKKADQLARQKEMEQAVEQIAESNPSPEHSPKHSNDDSKKHIEKDIEKDSENDIQKDEQVDNENTVVQPEPSSPPSSAAQNYSSPQGSAASWKAQADIYGEDEVVEKKKSITPNRINISAWFDAKGFLDALKPYINRITGRRFMAFSMSDGYVYFQAKVIEEVARKQAEQAGSMDIATMAADDPTMRQVLFTVVDHLRVEHDAVARELIKDQYFGGYFTIKTGGRAMKGFYTPFHAESLGSIAKMENKKKGILKNFKSVEPYVED